MFLVYKYVSVLNNSIYLECIYFVIIACHSVFHYKTNSISYRLNDLVWTDRMYNKINQSLMRGCIVKFFDKAMKMLSVPVYEQLKILVGKFSVLLDCTKLIEYLTVVFYYYYQDNNCMPTDDNFFFFFFI